MADWGNQLETLLILTQQLLQLPGLGTSNSSTEVSCGELQVANSVCGGKRLLCRWLGWSPPALCCS